MRQVATFFAMSLGCGVAACSDLTQCENEEALRVDSPSGNLSAVVFTRDCGATTSLSTQVSVLKSGEPLPNEAGNVLVLGDTATLSVRWKSDQELNVGGIGSTQPFVKESAVYGVAISFAPHAL